VKKSFFKLIIALLLQTAVFFIFYKILKINFITSFIISFNFIMLSSILVFGRSLTKNIYIFPLVLSNLLFIIIFFSVGNTAKLNNIVNDNSVISSVEAIKDKFVVSYSREESILIRDTFYLITVFEYDLAYETIKKVKRNSFTDEIETYILKSKQQFNNDFNKLSKYYINFDKIKEMYYKREYQYVLDRLKPDIANVDVENVYTIVRTKIMAIQNRDFLKKQMLKTINEFLKDSKNKSITFSHLFSALPGLYKVYKENFIEYENNTVTYRDFEGINDSTVCNGMFTIVNHEGKNTLIYVEKLIEPKNLYPLWGYNTYIIKENNVLKLGIVKITTNSIIYFDNLNINIINIPNIYNKIKNTPDIIKSPFNPLWLFTYKKEYYEVYNTMIKQFWIMFLKFILSIIFSTIIIMITIDYFKTIFPTIMPYFFYILPFIFLLFLSFLYSSLSIRFVNFIFKIF